MTVEEKKIFSFVDLLKFVFSFFIIMIHVDIFSDISPSLNYFFVNILTRVAVPFFFAVSGFFFVRSFDFSKQKKLSKTKSNFKRLRKTEWRIIVLYAVWSVIYMFWAMPMIYGSWSFGSLFDYALTSVIRCSFYHLWYVYALVFAYPLLYLMMRVLPRKAVTAVCVSLYIIGVVYNSYSRIFDISLINTLSERIDSISVSYLITNIFFRALPLMWLGACVAKRRKKPKKLVCLLLTVAGFGALVAENLLINNATDGAVTGHYLVFTVVCIYYLLLFSVQCRIKIKKRQAQDSET